MRKLEDQATGLIWYVPEFRSIIETTKDANNMLDIENNTFIEKDNVVLEEFRKELNQYHSEEITEYVTGNCANLGDFIKWATFDNRYPCYCFDNGKLVATAIINPNGPLGKLIELKDYIKYCEKHLSPYQNGLPGYISYKQAISILAKTTKNNNTDIDYLVVVPKHQGQGIGTRAVHSISHNLSFFAPNTPISTIFTQIHKANTPSKKVFQKNDFNIYTLQYSNMETSLDDYIKII